MDSFLSCSYEEMRVLQSANESQRVEDLERELSHSPSFDIDVWSDLFLLLCEFAILITRSSSISTDHLFFVDWDLNEIIVLSYRFFSSPESTMQEIAEIKENCGRSSLSCHLVSSLSSILSRCRLFNLRSLHYQ